nr:Arc family DNA-binding protein [Mesobaculum littorinae]
MANMTIRNLPDELHERLRAQAEANKRSLEAEVRSILLQAVVASSDGGLGHRMRARYGDYLGDDLSVERNHTASQASVFTGSSPRRK